MPLLLNARTAPVPVPPAGGDLDDVLAYHRRLPGYAPTPLVELPEVARACGVARVVVKAEVSRLGLPSFKVLGASWAAYRLLVERLGGVPPWSRIEDIGRVAVERLGRLRLVAATDGNHGRAVAHLASLWGLRATILVPEGTAVARIDAIAGEGADVLVVGGTYDDAVARSAEMAADDTLVVSDTSWPGYESTPRWVIDGYSTIFTELAGQLGADGERADGDVEAGAVARALDGIVDAVFVPIGVGALGAAAATALRSGLAPGDGPFLVGVEPDGAACVQAAVAAGEVVEVPGPHRSIMAGLNCGLASPVALPAVTAGFGAFVSVDDDRCRAAVRLLADAGLDVGETGAAALAGLLAVAEDHRSDLPLPADATVLLLATEGVTDPDNFRSIVGRAATDPTSP